MHGVESFGAIESDDSDAVWMNISFDEIVGATRSHDRQASRTVIRERESNETTIELVALHRGSHPNTVIEELT